MRAHTQHDVIDFENETKHFAVKVHMNSYMLLVGLEEVVMACGRSYAARRLCNTATTIALTPSDQLAMKRCREEAQL
jgi:hypothetical protein